MFARALVALASLAAVAALIYGAEAIAKRLLLWVMVLLVALAGSGCAFYIVPAEPKGYVCIKPHDWRCHPFAEWSDM